MVTRKALSCYYDLRFASNSFNFGTYLSIASTVATLNGMDSIDVYVIANDFRLTGIESEYGKSYSITKLYDIFPVLSSLFTMVSRLTILRHDDFEVETPCFPSNYKLLRSSQPSAISLMPGDFKFVEDLFLKHGIVTLINTEKRTLREKRYITISPRSSKKNLPRNTSNVLITNLIKECKEIYHDCDLVLVPDKEDLRLEYLSDADVQVDYDAAVQLRTRFQLYQGAVTNVMFSSGPNAMALVSSFPYLFLGIYDEQNQVFTKDFFRRKGPTFNNQLPWANKHQIIDWTSVGKYESPNVLRSILSSYKDIL